MSDGGQDDLRTALATGVVGSIPGTLIGVLLPVAYPLTPAAARVGVVIAGISVGLLAGFLLRAQLRNLVSGVWSLRLQHPKRFWTGCVLLVAMFIISGFGYVTVQPLLTVEKTIVRCTDVDDLVEVLCPERTSDFMIIAIRISSQHPLVQFPMATLKDSLAEAVGPSTREEKAVVSGPTGAFEGSAPVSVPYTKWLLYEPGSTIQVQASTHLTTKVADTRSGQGYLFIGSGLDIGTAPQEVNWARQPSIEFAYLVHFVEAPKSGQGLALQASATVLGRSEFYSSQVEVAIGDRLRVRLDLSNTTSHQLQDAVVTSKLPWLLSKSAAITGIMQSGLGTQSDTISIVVKGSGAYLNYHPESTSLSEGGAISSPIPDRGGVGPLFTPEGINPVLGPDPSVHNYVYFDVDVDRLYVPSGYVPASW
jgi:hypothetical protein